MGKQGSVKVVLILVVLITIIAVFFLKLKPLKTPDNKISTTQENTKCDSLRLEKSEDQKSATIICVNAGVEIQGAVLTDMYLNHYHAYEINGGNIYLIRRLGYSGYPDETWTDELWEYKTDLSSKKLASDKGLDFRVAEDGKMIVAYTNDYLIILNGEGSVLKTFQASEMIANAENEPMFNFHAWGPDAIWVENTLGPSLAGLVKIDTKTFEVTKYNLRDLSAGPEFEVNVNSSKIALSNYPPMFDEDTAKEYKLSGAKVNLVIYDLNSKTQKIVATSITKPFAPTWLDANTLEFNDPSGTGRKQMKIE